MRTTDLTIKELNQAMKEKDEKPDHRYPHLTEAKIETISDKDRRLQQAQIGERFAIIARWADHPMDRPVNIDRWGNDWGD